MTAPTADFFRLEYAHQNQLRADLFGAFMDAIVRGRREDAARLGDDLLAANAVAGYTLTQLVAAVRKEQTITESSKNHVLTWQSDTPSIPRRSVS